MKNIDSYIKCVKNNWNRIGYIEGKVSKDEISYKVKTILFVRDPFLWLRTRKAVEIGDRKIIEKLQWSSAHLRDHDMQVKNWLLGGKINYVSENGTSKPAEIIKLVKT